MPFSIKADKLVAHNLKTPSKSAIYLAPEDIGADSTLGHLFILAEISSKEKKVPEILDQTLKELMRQHFRLRRREPAS